MEESVSFARQNDAARRSVQLRSGERIDDLQYGGFRLIQNPSLFCFSTDAVLLSAFARVPRGASVVDLGAGNGILEVLLYSRQPDALYKAIEISAASFDLLERNIELNGLGDAAEIYLGDIREAPRVFGTNNTMCVCNPPFAKARDGFIRQGLTHDIARKELLITFREICTAAASCLGTGGRFCLVHRTERLAEVLSSLRDAHLEPKTLQLCAGAPNKEPKTMLVMAQKGAAEGMRVLPQLNLRTADGMESAEARIIYRREERTL